MTAVTGRRGLVLVVPIAVVALGAILFVVAAGDDDPSDERVTASPVPTSDDEEAPSETPEAVQATNEPSTPSEPSGPTFGPGTYVVGEDIQPGRYVIEDVEQCYWERRTREDEGASILANGNVSGRAVVEILEADGTFTSDECPPWALWSAPAAPVTEFGPGDWVVGAEIEPGRYRNEGGAFCYYERATSFDHELSNVVERDDAGFPVTVEIAPTDERFSSSGCGSWRPFGPG